MCSRLYRLFYTVYCGSHRLHVAIYISDDKSEIKVSPSLILTTYYRLNSHMANGSLVDSTYTEHLKLQKGLRDSTVLDYSIPK